MSGNGAKLTTRQHSALNALLHKPTITAAAAECGLGARTISRYLSNADFRAELQRRQAAILTATTAGLVSYSGAALNALLSVLGDKRATNAERISAARALFTWMEKRIEVADLVERMERIEALLLERDK